MWKEFLPLTLISPLLLCGPTWFLAYIPPKTTWVQMEAPLKISFFYSLNFLNSSSPGRRKTFLSTWTLDKPLPFLPPTCEQTFFSWNPSPSLFYMVYGCRHTEQTYNFPMFCFLFLDIFMDFAHDPLACQHSLWMPLIKNARYFKNLDKILDDFEQNKIFGQKVSWNNFE